MQEELALDIKLLQQILMETSNEAEEAVRTKVSMLGPLHNFRDANAVHATALLHYIPVCSCMQSHIGKMHSTHSLNQTVCTPLHPKGRGGGGAYQTCSSKTPVCILAHTGHLLT